MGWFSRHIFGGTDTAKELVELGADSIRGVGNWIDEAQFTPEEQSKATAARHRTALDYLKATLDENSIRNITRRILAWTITGLVAYAFVLGTVLVVFDLDYTVVLVGTEHQVISRVDRILALAEALKLGWAFTAVVVAYFGVHWERARARSKQNDKE